VIAIADEDGGGVTPSAAERVLRVLGLQPGLAAKVAAALDADSDGRISEEEVLSAFAAYYVTPEP
jgi:hypothetical protein